MNAKLFYETVKRMRKAQKNYFRTRLDCYLKESKELERQVDNVIEKNGGYSSPKTDTTKIRNMKNTLITITIVVLALAAYNYYTSDTAKHLCGKILKILQVSIAKP
ncbi:MAG: hypothetical protein II939_14640 [Bacteroidales bacterium]|nr:hypothetical protein [Bacteroidales bacterium]